MPWGYPCCRPTYVADWRAYALHNIQSATTTRRELLLKAAVMTSYAKITEGQKKFDFHPVPINLGGSNVNCVSTQLSFGHYEVTVKPFPKQTRQSHWIALTDRKDLKPTAKWQIRQIPVHLRCSSTVHQSNRGYVITKYIKKVAVLAVSAIDSDCNSEMELFKSNFRHWPLQLRTRCHVMILVVHPTHDEFLSFQSCLFFFTYLLLRLFYSIASLSHRNVLLFF
ncbi:GPI-anchored surface protein, putative [Bodo saltans]|uniref:GPI-anchored surface protein, putative n=1 Tax=Bodo saltans TaxID=75058 RepID=A0A0S4KF33_BODSA|nr:GPI-anchored surface protein, putative [Bodo saltans]|eukprot:CUI14268.1 GPI-anchored surface protein, putative [Bodo saltans]